jgi:hypothetical protein
MTFVIGGNYRYDNIYLMNAIKTAAYKELKELMKTLLLAKF